MRTKILALLTLVAAAACEIPGRGNPRDPANLPDVRIEIYEDEVGGTPIVQASFTESVFLAARKSEPANHDLRVRWFVEVPGFEERFDVNDGEEYRTDDPRAPFRFSTALPASAIAGGVAGVTVVARVRDLDTGGTAEGSRFFQLVNRAPTIVTQRYVEVPPGGRWWKSSPAERSFETILDVFAEDPDPGDGVTVKWEQISGRPVTTNTSGLVQDLRVPVPLWEQTLGFRAHVTDDAGTETIADVILAVQDIVWITDGAGLVRRAQEPSVAVSLVTTTADGWTLGAATTGGGETVVWTAERGAIAGNWLVVRRTPEASAAATSSFDTGLDASANPLRGGTYTNNGGVVWFGAGTTILAFADTATVGAPVFTATNRTLVTLSQDAITAPHSLAPVTGSGTGDAWALLLEAGMPTVARLSTTNGVLVTSTVIPSAIAIEPASDGGAWVLVSDPADAGFAPTIRRLDASGAEIASLALPFPATAQARTFAARSPLNAGVESLRVALAGGGPTVNSYLALVEARDAVTGAPSDGLAGEPKLAVTFRLQEAPVTDVALDPQDGGAWALVPSTGRVRKYSFDGGVVRSAGDLDFLPVGVPPMLKADLRTGAAWIADHAGSLRGIPSAPIVPYPDSAVLSSPDRLQLDPIRNRLAAAGEDDLSVLVTAGSEVERQFFLPDLGAPAGPVGASFDPDSGCVWLASAPGPGGVPPSRLARQICRDGVSVVLPNVTSAGIPQIHAIDFDAVSSGLCIAGLGSGGTLELTVLEPNGTTLPSWDRVAMSGSTVTGVRASPEVGDAACWVLTDSSIARVDPLTGAILEAVAPFGATSLTAGPDGRAYFVDPIADRIRRARPFGDAGCASPICFDDFRDFALTDTYRNARSVAVDPVRGIVWVSLGPKGGDDSPPALLQFTPAGERIGTVPASDPVHVIVNR